MEGGLSSSHVFFKYPSLGHCYQVSKSRVIPSLTEVSNSRVSRFGFHIKLLSVEVTLNANVINLTFFVNPSHIYM